MEVCFFMFLQPAVIAQPSHQLPGVGEMYELNELVLTVNPFNGSLPAYRKLCFVKQVRTDKPRLVANSKR